MTRQDKDKTDQAGHGRQDRARQDRAKTRKGDPTAYAQAVNEAVQPSDKDEDVNVEHVATADQGAFVVEAEVVQPSDMDVNGQVDVDANSQQQQGSVDFVRTEVLALEVEELRHNQHASEASIATLTGECELLTQSCDVLLKKWSRCLGMCTVYGSLLQPRTRSWAA